MKKLTEKDLPVLASLIRWATHRKVAVFQIHLSIIRNSVYTASVTIKDGKALATDIIPGFIMKSIPTSSVWSWEILI